jgi:hypothetical protein
VDCFRLDYVDVAEVFYVVAESAEAGVETCGANGSWAHVDSATAGAKIHRCADDG